MKILIVSPVPTDPPTAGNRARVLSLFTALKQLGHDVTFAYVPYEQGSEDYDAMRKRLQQRLRILQCRWPPFPSRIGNVKRKISKLLRSPSAYLWGVDEWFDNNLLPQIASLQNSEKFETVVMEYVFLSKLASVFPSSVRTVIDTHDLFGNRHKQYLNNKMQPTWLATTANQEIRALKRADAVIAIQEEEAQYLKRHGVNEVHCVGHLSTAQPTPFPDPGGARLFFVGSGNPINVQGLEWFLSSVMPKIRKAFPTCKLAVAGPVSQRRVWPDEVLVLGEVESLATEYAKATVVINPVTFGTGLAVKTIEALSYGKAVVATDAGARGLGSEFSAVLCITKDASTFAKRVIELLRDTSARAEQSRNAIAIMNKWRKRQFLALDSAVKGIGERSASVE